MLCSLHSESNPDCWGLLSRREYCTCTHGGKGRAGRLHSLSRLSTNQNSKWVINFTLGLNSNGHEYITFQHVLFTSANILHSLYKLGTIIGLVPGRVWEWDYLLYKTRISSVPEWMQWESLQKQTLWYALGQSWWHRSVSRLPLWRAALGSSLLPGSQDWSSPTSGAVPDGGNPLQDDSRNVWL